MKKNLVILLATLLTIAMIGEITVRTLQQMHHLPDYRKGNISGQPNKAKPPKYIRSQNPILYVEHDTSAQGINRWGTRDPDFQQDKSPETYRIAVIGDSVSFGYGVNYAESYPYILQSILNQNREKTPKKNPVEIINFSVSGYGMDAYLEMYRTKVRFFHPDMVLVGYVQNDPAPTRAVETAVVDMMSGKKYRLQLARYSQLAAWIYLSIEKIRGGIAAKKEWAYFQQDDVLSHTLKQFRQFNQMLIEDRTTGLVVIFPYLLDFSDYPLTKVHRVLTEQLAAEHLSVCDLLPAFSIASNVRDYGLQGNDVVHLSPAGNRFVANQISQCIEKQFNDTMRNSEYEASAYKHP